ncbi:anther-specific proline-rich protein APG-like [Quercus robur]|uniref:anther-specific proline-rich protein APG-like n=1 Tax=Quercus robur TaxID=38942 RepID=UPI0021616C36|nr:anther-specific proline-rich protein APG-like [Quercus robur]
MISSTHCWSPQKLLMMLLFLLTSFSFPTSATVSQKLDQTPLPQEADTEVKCGSCPCSNPCVQQPPLPPPSPPPPPPPPSPTPNNPSTPYCPPLAPPPPRFTYVTSVPGGNLYNTDPNYPIYNTWVYHSSADRNMIVELLLLLGFGVLELLVIWETLI